MRRLALATCLALGFSGCQTHRIADLTLVANRNVPLQLEPVQSSLSGEDCAIDGFGVASLEEAIDIAQRRAPEAHALTNVTIEMRIELYVLFTRRCFLVRGDAVKVGT
jgi:hypothetical protein